MKKTLFYLLAVLFAINLWGCKKDTDSTTTDYAIYGLWQVTSSPTMPSLKFVNFKSDKTLYAYSEHATGFKSIINTNFTPGDDQIIADFGNYVPVIYNYSISGNTLKLTGNNGQTFLTATKSTSTDPDTWVTDVTSTDIIQGLFTTNNHGIGYDGNNLLFSDYSGSKIVKVSLATRTVTSELASASSINTIEYDGTDYWVSRNGYNTLEKVNTAGASIFTSTSMGAWLYGIGYVSPTSIICYSNNEQTLYNYNPTTDAVTNSVEVSDMYLGDIAVSGGKVFIIDNGGNTIYRLNPTTFAVEKSYRVTDAQNINGIASVGNNTFWLNTQYGAAIIKVELN